jgi:hypothetical protein
LIGENSQRDPIDQQCIDGVKNEWKYVLAKETHAGQGMHNVRVENEGKGTVLAETVYPGENSQQMLPAFDRGPEPEQTVAAIEVAEIGRVQEHFEKNNKRKEAPPSSAHS